MASLAASSGIPEEVIQRMGNWRDRRMVSRYAKFSDSVFREAASKMAGIVLSHRITSPDSTASEAEVVDPEDVAGQ